MKRIQVLRTILFVTALFLWNNTIAQSKPRTIITTDGEIDDVDSFIRMLLYANEFKIVGLIYSSSMWHYKGDGHGTRFISEMEMTKKMYGEKTDLRWPGTTWMNGLIDAYEQVYPKLRQHARDYPTAQHLRSLIRVGNIDFEGEMAKVTPGSEYIQSRLMDNDSTPLYLQVWGGTNTIARALKSIEEQYSNTSLWSAIYTKVCAKAILFTILDQDATYKKYIAVKWPDLRVYYNAHQFGCLAYPWKRLIDSSQWHWLQGDFMRTSIIQQHGPLLSQYYSYGDGKKQAGDDEHIHGDSLRLLNTMWGSFEPYDFISEGDSPAFLHLIDVGLDNVDDPSYGGWGGRLKKSKSNAHRWEDGAEVADYNPISGQMDKAYPQVRWLPAIQADFAARADWCIRDYKDANHPPSLMTKQKNIEVQAGSAVNIKVRGKDPDKNKLNYSFWHYTEAGNSGRSATILTKGNTAVIRVPEDASAGETFHIIAEAKDNGQPALTRYQRIILYVKE